MFLHTIIYLKLIKINDKEVSSILNPKSKHQEKESRNHRLSPPKFACKNLLKTHIQITTYSKNIYKLKKF